MLEPNHQLFELPPERACLFVYMDDIVDDIGMPALGRAYGN